MLSLTRQLHRPLLWLHTSATTSQLHRPLLWLHTSATTSQLHHHRLIRTDSAAPTRQRRRTKLPGTTTAMLRKKTEEKSEWWIVDGEMHEIGDNVPVRERFVIPRDNLPNRRRKQMREQFMRRTRLVLKDSEHEPFCKKYMELYNELRENWERLYWDEGYSKKLASDHANYDSAEDDDRDFSPYRKSESYNDLMKEQSPGRSRQFEALDKVSQIRDKFEYDREKRMREKAFAPMRPGFVADDGRPSSKIQPFDMNRYFSSEDEDE